MREHAPGSTRDAGNLPAPEGSAPNVRVQMAMHRRLIQRKADAAAGGQAEASQEKPAAAAAEGPGGADDAPGGEQADAAGEQQEAEGGEPDVTEPLEDNLQEEFGTALGADFSG